MPFEVSCSCGQRFLAQDHLAGKQVACPACGQPFFVTPPAAPPASDAPVGQADPPPPAAPTDAALERDLRRLQQQSQSAASNPGRLRVNFLRYAYCFPTWPAVWLSLLLLSLGLTVFVHWVFVLLLLPAVVLNFLYWRQVRARFIAGCVNPGRVVSLDPPLIAVATNLTRSGDASCTAIKILRHPLGRLKSVKRKLGEPLATIAFYDAWSEEGSHWNDFSPVAANAATGKVAELQRLKSSLSSDDWNELDRGLQQVPRPFEPGIYRTYLEPGKRLSPQELPQHLPHIVVQCLPHDREKGCYLAAFGIPPDVLQKALSICGPDLQNSHVLAVVGREGDFDSGVMVITLAGVGYHIGKLGVGRFAWHDVLGAFVAYSETEVTLANHQRIDFPESSFQPMYALESLFNQVAGLE